MFHFQRKWEKRHSSSSYLGCFSMFCSHWNSTNCFFSFSFSFTGDEILVIPSLCIERQQQNKHWDFQFRISFSSHLLFGILGALAFRLKRDIKSKKSNIFQQYVKFFVWTLCCMCLCFGANERLREHGSTENPDRLNLFLRLIL